MRHEGEGDYLTTRFLSISAKDRLLRTALWVVDHQPALMNTQYFVHSVPTGGEDPQLLLQKTAHAAREKATRHYTQRSFKSPSNTSIRSVTSARKGSADEVYAPAP